MGCAVRGGPHHSMVETDPHPLALPPPH
eukprot:SAG31_NODE_7565_length_1652_cov_1.869929_1_plen_27_part_10